MYSFVILYAYSYLHVRIRNIMDVVKGHINNNKIIG